MEKDTRSMFFDLENDSFRLSCAVKMLDAIHCAMTEGCHAPESYTDALFSAYEYLREISDAIAGRIREIFKTIGYAANGDKTK